MLVICVLTAVIGYLIYTVTRIKIQGWIDDLSMSRLSLKKKSGTRGTEHESVTSDSNQVVEISEDESDISPIKVISESEGEVISSSPSDTNDQRPDSKECVKNDDKETLKKFQQSTDSLESDEDDRDPVFNSYSGVKPSKSLFDWKRQTKNTNRTKSNMNKGSNLDYDNSESSDDSYQDAKWLNNKKKVKMSDYFDSAKKQNQIKVEEDAPPEVTIHHEQMIAGVKVKFPMKPYSCQIAVMNKVIQGCTKEENCLLESPTGSGKTLALLCGVLAWQDHYSVELEKLKPKTCGGPSVFNYDAALEKVKSFTHDFDDEDSDLDVMENTGKTPKMPKVYYGTRTHKQIEQVIRELRKTNYAHKKITILSSREHTCIQDSTRNKTELCNDLLDPAKHKGCPFYNESNKKALSSFGAMKAYGMKPVWDIEDLVTLGKEEDLCPYFAARNLMMEADVIFCPYNYLIDPDIRESMQISLKDQVIILDEAHNIEDICRDAASVDFREDYLVAAANECESLTKQRAADFSTYNTIKVYILKFVTFLKQIGVDKIGFNADSLSSPYWTGAELMELFNMHNIGESAYPDFLNAGNAAIADATKAKEDLRSSHSAPKPIISNTTKIIIQHLIFTMQMISPGRFTNDYRACVTETMVKDFQYAADDTWYSSHKKEQRARTLKLMCMNPGVIFEPLANAARSVILASGTLSPTASFQSELGTKFAHVLNAPHVVPKEQVYATCIPKGPNRVPLKANYQNVNSWSFQDELGRVVFDICQAVPHGVLCFFSSYHVMNTQIERWKNNSTWNKITSIKEVFLEPRYGGDLHSTMKKYRDVIEETSDSSRGKINGALFLAVFRGKVAEGIDFRDDEARCVVTVGIPYAVRTDPVIDMKLKYNDLNTARGLLRGSEWYTIQAFRALNQALGRCLRHIDDWGAVLLIDERLQSPDSKAYLPKWVKTMWISHNGYNLTAELQDFVARQRTRESKK